MIDNVKFYFTSKDEFERNACKSSKIDFKTFVSTLTGEMSDYPKLGKCQNLEVRITENTAFISGSLHKFMNFYLTGEEYNYNDFDFRDINLVVEEIENFFDIHPANTKITNLEFGFNIHTKDINPQIIIDNNILMFNYSDHSKNLKFRGKGDFKEFEKTDYSVKIYNKSKQYGLDENILRIEIKFYMKRTLQNIGVFSLEDLKSPDVIRDLFAFLMDKFERLTIVDEFYHRSDISFKDMEKLIQFTNPNYWVSVFKGKSIKVRKKLIRDFEKLLSKHKLNMTKLMLRNKLGSKFLNLIK